MASSAPRRPRKAKKAVLVIDAIAEAKVAPAKPGRATSARKPRSNTTVPTATAPARPRRKTAAAPGEPTPEPVSAARRALLAALQATATGVPDAHALEPIADEGVIYTRSVADPEPDATPRAVEAPEEPAWPAAPSKVGPGVRLKLALEAIDSLPPIRLPIGPAIRWRFGLPALVALLLCLAVLSRSSAHAESTNSFKLPAETETYAVTQESPLFANSQQQQQPIGVAEPAGLNVDVLDLTLKLVAVLALAYGSLAALKRLGIGGAGSPASGSGGSTTDGLRVLSTLALAPNRSVHVVRAPDGKTLLLGATPGQVNLIAELGEVPEVAGSASGSFLDILTSKLQH